MICCLSQVDETMKHVFREAGTKVVYNYLERLLSSAGASKKSMSTGGVFVNCNFCALNGYFKNRLLAVS